MNEDTQIDDAALLAECDVETFRASGPGGQNVNRRETAVRLRHRPTGLVVTGREERSQLQNKRRALGRLRWRLAARAVVRPSRKATRMSNRVRERILEDKRRRSAVKASRRRPPFDEPSPPF